MRGGLASSSSQVWISPDPPTTTRHATNATPKQFTSDAVHRNYVLSSLDASIDDFNDAVALLAVPTTPDLWEALSAEAGREISEEAGRLAEAWGAVAAEVRPRPLGCFLLSSLLSAERVWCVKEGGCGDKQRGSLFDAVTQAGRLQFDKAAQRVPEIERKAKRVLTLAERVAAGLHPAQCTRKRRVVVVRASARAASSPSPITLRCLVYFASAIHD